MFLLQCVAKSTIAVTRQESHKNWVDILTQQYYSTLMCLSENMYFLSGLDFPP